MDKCLHGLEKQTCYLCTHPYSSHSRQRSQIYLEKVYQAKKSQLNDDRHYWAVEEFEFLYHAFSKGFDRIKLIQTCLVLNRTKLAVAWQYQHMIVRKQWDRCHNMMLAIDHLTTI